MICSLDLVQSDPRREKKGGRKYLEGKITHVGMRKSILGYYMEVG